MGGVVSAGVDNDDLVDKLKEADYIKTEIVEKIFRLVDRGFYMTKDSQNIAYRDNAWRSGNLHISAPCIYAQVMEGLQLDAGMSFLNIGSGTGYLSTMAGLLIGPNGINHGIELHGDVVEYARERLTSFLANTGSIDVCFFCEPQFSQGNALCLKEETFLYDRVYCGASCPASHENYMKNLIKINGILVMPRNDKLMKIVRTGKTSWTQESLLPVSFSSLVMPDNTLSTEQVELPPVNIISLQELSREAIRSIFRSRIEDENNLKSAFVYTVPENTSPRTRKPTSRLGRSFPNTTMSDTEDTDDSEDGEGDWERLSGSAAQNLQDSMHSAFIELARTFMTRRAANLGRAGRGESDMADQREEVEEEAEEQEEEEEEEEDEDNHSEHNELFLGNGHDLIVRIIERVNRRPRPSDNPTASSESPAAAAGALNTATESSSPTTNNDASSLLVENTIAEDKTEDDSIGMYFTPFDVNLRSEDEIMEADNKEEVVEVDNKEVETGNKEEEIEADNREENIETDSKEEDREKQNNGKHIADTSTATVPNSTTEDEDMLEDQNEILSQEQLESQNVDKEVKKREKFDSGIVEDLDPHAMSIDSSSSCSFKSRSNSVSSLSDSDETKKLANTGEQESPTYSLRNNTGNCNNHRVWSKVRMNRRKKRAMKSENESKTDSSEPIQKYSQLMKEKIKELPLPLPLQVFVNYNRPL